MINNFDLSRLKSLLFFEKERLLLCIGVLKRNKVWRQRQMNAAQIKIIEEKIYGIEREIGEIENSNNLETQQNGTNNSDNGSIPNSH